MFFLFVLFGVDWTKVEWNESTFKVMAVIYLIGLCLYGMLVYGSYRKGTLESDVAIMVVAVIVWPLTDTAVALSMLNDIRRAAFGRKRHTY